jgi:hypothetical protein
MITLHSIEIIIELSEQARAYQRQAWQFSCYFLFIIVAEAMLT